MNKAKVDLSSCDREPIHIPGSIQSHGVLLAIDDSSRIRAYSDNLGPMIGFEDDALGRMLGEVLPQLDSASFDSTAGPHETACIEISGSEWDVSRHQAGPLTLVELEPAAPSPSSSDALPIKALRALQRSRSVDETARVLVREIRMLTGFDRVMVYRFRSDLSGEVVAEDARPDLGPYLGLRYPSTDIPAQARHLYVVNPIRTIADIGSVPVPIVPESGPGSENPLDLSHSVLRSVSPIHIEYLTNMGVRASMSISLIVEDRLWGLVACHHYSGKRHASPSLRASCELLGQNASMLIDAELRRKEALDRTRANDLIGRLMKAAEKEEDLIAGLTSRESDLLELTQASGAVVTVARRSKSVGAVPPDSAIQTIVGALEEIADDAFVSHALSEQIEQMRDQASLASGVLAVNFNREDYGWIIWFRKETIHDVNWAGDPNKVDVGSLGARLTPRGSFDLYVETVRGRSDAWTQSDILAARELRNRVSDLSLERNTQLRKMREMMMAMVGHDLRSPLSAISMATSLMEDESDPSDADLRGSIDASSTRMKRLVDLMLDMSRINSGQGIVPDLQRVDLKKLALRIVTEARLGFPGVDYEFKHSGSGVVAADSDRIEQVLSNLVSNARHHGTPGTRVRIELDGESQDHVILRVANKGKVIPEHVRKKLFDPFVSEGQRSRSGGLGLGLYITKTIVDAHEGTIDVTSSDEETNFTVRLPRNPEDAGGEDD